MTKKSVIDLGKISKKKVNLMYKAALVRYPEFIGLEYQCNREELKVFKKLVVAMWVAQAVSEHVFKKEAVDAASL